MEKIVRCFMVILFGVLCMGVYSIAEEITLTTYYPAPYGAYVDLTATNSLVIGSNYAGTETAPTSGMLVEGNVGIGTTSAATKLDVNGTVKATGYATGTETGVATGTFTTEEGKTVTVTNGIITSII